jgi:Flp pilus assembly protein TadD
MTKSTISASLLTVVLLLTLVERSTIATAGTFDWASFSPSTESSACSTAEDDDRVPSDSSAQKRGNGFVRALGAPFRALGRLFGGGKKNEQPARRITDKEAKKFESTVVTRVKDASVKAQTPPSPANQAVASTSDPTRSILNARLENGRALLLSGNVNEAITELSSADKKSGEVNKLLGIAYESKGLHDKALEAFELALHCEPNNPEHLNNLGYQLYKTRDYDRAAKYLKRGTKQDPNNARLWNNLGLVQSEQGNFGEAYKAFARAVGEFHGHLNVAIQLQQRGYGKDAIKHLEQAQLLQPNSADVLTRLVSLYEITGRPTDAENARRSLVALKTFADAAK